jgi:hypothetical protein
LFFQLSASEKRHISHRPSAVTVVECLHKKRKQEQKFKMNNQFYNDQRIAIDSDSSSNTCRELDNERCVKAFGVAQQIRCLSLQEKNSRPKLRVNEERMQMRRLHVDEESEGGSSRYTGYTSSKKSLSFHPDVRVYEFNTVIGDNPGVSHGCPVALDSELLKKKMLCLRDMERYSERRSRGDLKLSGIERTQR